MNSVFPSRTVRLSASSLPPQGAEFIASCKDAQFFKPKGCEKCRGYGYLGRTGIFEVMTMSDRLGRLVNEGAGIAALRGVAVQEGMKTLMCDALAKAAQGITSVEEALRIAPAEMRN